MPKTLRETLIETAGAFVAAPGELGAGRTDRATLARRIQAAVTRARAALIWESLWPRLIWPVGIVLAFIAVSWLGIWTLLPDAARLGLLILFGLALVASLVLLRGLRVPTHADGLARLERHSGLLNRPLQTLEDDLPPTTDAVTRALWSAHRARLAASIGNLRAGLPAPGVDRADRYALRVVLALILFVGFFAAGDTKLSRIVSAFRPFTAGSTVEARLDAWVTPPDYTGKPAILLTAEGGAPLETDGTIKVPQGSSVVIRASGVTTKEPTLVDVTDVGAKTTKPLAQKAADAGTDTTKVAGPNPVPPAEFELKLATSSEVQVSRGGTRLARWRFSVVPDAAPTITFVGTPEPQESGTLKIAYNVADEYGVVNAEARFEPAPDNFPVTTNAATVRPLVTPPEFPLSLPSGHARTGQATTFRDLTSHPWAGGKVRVTLYARNEAGEEGHSETKVITLPARSFTKPLARALVEQRRILALDANRQPQVNDAFDALLIAPEHFYESSAVFLGVSKIHRDLINAKSDDNLRDVVAFIWEVALGIEDGNLTQAEKAVRDAEEALQKALDNGASDKDIAKLTQDLREAMDRYMRELAEAARKNPGLRRQPSPNQQVLRQQDLNRMLDRIENLAKTGSKDAAREMLSQLQRMMENLDQAQNGDEGDQQQSEENQALDKLGEMIQRQQQLMDRTHRLDRNGDQLPGARPGQNQQGQNQQGQADKPMTPEERLQALKDLQQNQRDLRKALKDLQDKLAQQGYGKKPGQQKAPGKGNQPGQGQQPGQGGPGDQPGGDQQADGDDSPFGQAGEAMGDAGEALGDDATGDAIDAQGRAIDRLREGAKKLVDQMAQSQGRRRRTGIAQGGESSGNDPLGRPFRNVGPQDSNSVKVPDEIDTQRARQVLEAIRQRLSEPMRPRLELDYLERLLQGE